MEKEDERSKAAAAMRADQILLSPIYCWSSLLNV